MSAKKLTDGLISSFSKLNKLTRLDFSKPKVETLKQTSENVSKTPEKIKLRQKMLNYIKTVALDYRDVAKDTWKSMNERPFKALSYTLSMGFVYVLYKTNPNEFTYENRLIECSNDLIMCSKTIRSESSEEYLSTIRKMKNYDLLKYKSYILFSLILHENFNKDCDLFEQQCKQLNKPNKWNIFNVPNRFKDFKDSIVDIGLLNNWYYLEKRMLDFDVNDSLKN